MTLSDELVAAWHFILCDEDPFELLAAARYLGKTEQKEIYVPADIIRALAELRAPLSSAEEAWASGPAKASGFDAEIWRQWGGASRYGYLPSPEWCENPEAARREISFARKEFIELYRAVRERDSKEQAHLTHRDAKQALGFLEKLGLDTQKLIEG